MLHNPHLDLDLVHQTGDRLVDFEHSKHQNSGVWFRFKDAVRASDSGGAARSAPLFSRLWLILVARFRVLVPELPHYPNTRRFSPSGSRELLRVMSRTSSSRSACTSSSSSRVGFHLSKRYKISTPKTRASAAIWPTVGSLMAPVRILSTSSERLQSPGNFP
jgi:hypothetical protein